MPRILALLILLAFAPSLVIGSTEVNQSVEQYQAQNYSAALASLGTQDADSNPTELYLYFKTQQKLGDQTKSLNALRQMNQQFKGPLRQVVLWERMEFYALNKDSQSLLDIAVGFPKDIKNPFLINRLALLLSRGFKNIPPSDALKTKLESIFERFEDLQSNSAFLQLYLSTLSPTDPKNNWALIKLFETADYTKLDLNLKKRFDFIRGTMIRYKDTIARHFQAQYRFRNYTYLREAVPLYLRYYKEGDRPTFLTLRDLYFDSYFSARKYSEGLQKISDPASALLFDFSEGELSFLAVKFNLSLGREIEALAAIKVLDKAGYQDLVHQARFKLGSYYFGQSSWKEAFEQLALVDTKGFKTEQVSDLQWKLFLVNQQIGHRANLKKIAAWAERYSFKDIEEGARFCYWGYKLELYIEGSLQDCYHRYPLTFYGLKARSLANNNGQSLPGHPDPEFQFKRRPLQVEESEYFEMLRLLYDLDEQRLADSIVFEEEAKLKDLTYFDELRGLLAAADRFYLLHQLVSQHQDHLLGDTYYGNHHILPLLYPQAFQSQVTRYAEEARVSEMLVYAVMREESRFRPYVKSFAGAIGLLQLMPKTARFVGRSKRIRVSTSQLIDPDLNLRLGTIYLNDLSKRFEGNLYYTLAAYNGGASNVNRWKLKLEGPEDMDLFVEMISFNETKNYVKRVLKSYYLYQSIYGPR
ncbi:MAG: hypothetical protein A2508_06160 [Candidatus Lambdaproteobacteria bacterium RIFOXYD12_FULL_49_8]|uniref:Transglycosylase SLT domain-containing protein n=1 Tax=Candidatus Lambdaproteobacteria bacterium RIFOXYD2_FULL_50_16 TaxID=1817772 RepID=A0A1F6G6D6_9PROT|nr:MAG: hypothetical protein A2527_11140 [Candidatus Lambdaproteobacteria bacterium RIFOXYD2_FULL_50_16]OGG96416.1 MAG: hypothetical protein A2508_06160 [Candidatus Lambdaproteobacteria bacterium RIFOXYD12_FULL_49_8]